MEITFNDESLELHKVWELFLTTGWNTDFQLTESEFIDGLKNSWYTVSAFYGKDLVGFGRILSDGIIHAVIFEMIIAPEYQGKGIGREVMNRLLGKCKENNIRDIQLFCAKGKTSFYEKLGFVKRSDNAPGMDYCPEK